MSEEIFENEFEDEIVNPTFIEEMIDCLNNGGHVNVRYRPTAGNIVVRYFTGVDIMVDKNVGIFKEGDGTLRGVADHQIKWVEYYE